jgi:hypothetical protein
MGIARLLHVGLGQRGYHVGEIENYRDSGWNLSCSMGEAKMEVALARFVDGSQWLLQIAPAYLPGIIGRLLGKKQSADPSNLFALAQDIHELLRTQGQFFAFEWYWDGYPEDDASTPQPVQTTS